MQPDNLISLKDDMVAFIAGHGMRRLSAFITEEVPTVIFIPIGERESSALSDLYTATASRDSADGVVT